MKHTLLGALASFMVIAAAYATAPVATSNAIVNVPLTDIAEAVPNGGLYDSDALICIDAASTIEAAANEVRCWKCGDSSKDGCSGGDKYCYGERSDCLKKGCRITGSKSSCGSSDTQC